MKRVFITVAALFLLSSGLVFAAGEREKASPAQGAAKVFRIAYSLPPVVNAWQAKYRENVLEVAAKDRDRFIFDVKHAVDDADQLNMLQTFKAGGYDMIMLYAQNGTLMTPIMEEIHAAGIKTFVVNRAIATEKYSHYLAGDNYQGGVNAAHYFGKRLNGRGNIAVLRSFAGTPIDLQRYGGFADTLKKDYPGIRIIVEGDGQFAQQAGLEAMSNILPAHPRIDAVYTQDDEAAIGAITAIENAKRTDIQFVTGFGGSKTAYKYLQEKHPLFGASMSYFPTMGGDAMEVAKKILLGESQPQNIIHSTHVVTADNVQQFLSHAY